MTTTPLNVNLFIKILPKPSGDAPALKLIDGPNINVLSQDEQSLIKEFIQNPYFR